jgi:site-specific recombinase XerD
MEKRVSLRVLFYIKRTKLWEDGRAPIYVKLTYNRTYAEMAINRAIKPSLWDNNKCIVKGNSKEAKQLNSLFETIEFQLQEYLRILREDNKVISAKSIKKAFLGIDDDKMTILSIFRDHNDNINKLINIDYSPATCQKYETCSNYVQEYIKLRYKKEDLELAELNHQFVTYFESFLKSEKGIGHNTAIKYLTNLKKIIRIALSNNWMKSNPFANYKFQLKKVDRGFLNEDELEAIKNLKLSFGRLATVRDCFLVSCFTGLAYSDLKGLSKTNVIKGTDGKTWIDVNRRKTDVRSKIPVLPVVQNIFNKYADHPKCILHNVLLPVLTNQKMNAYLKEIADLAGISKNLTTHLARHTFATTVTLNNDVPIESVSKMLGHSSINMTKTYARLLDKKVGNDMEKLHAKYAS